MQNITICPTRLKNEKQKRAMFREHFRSGGNSRFPFSKKHFATVSLNLPIIKEPDNADTCAESAYQYRERANYP